MDCWSKGCTEDGRDTSRRRSLEDKGDIAFSWYKRFLDDVDSESNTHSDEAKPSWWEDLIGIILSFCYVLFCFPCLVDRYHSHRERRCQGRDTRERQRKCAALDLAYFEKHGEYPPSSMYTAYARTLPDVPINKDKDLIPSFIATVLKHYYQEFKRTFFGGSDEDDEDDEVKCDRWGNILSRPWLLFRWSKNKHWRGQTIPQWRETHTDQGLFGRS